MGAHSNTFSLRIEQQLTETTSTGKRKKTTTKKRIDDKVNFPQCIPQAWKAKIEMLTVPEADLRCGGNGCTG